jgi:hypothetical protein
MKKRFTNIWDIHRFRCECNIRIESGVSPVPRQPPQSKTLSRVREMSASHDCHE